MASLRVVDVVRADPELLQGCWIDWPIQGSHVSSQAIDVAGWALGRNHDAVAVELVHEGVVLRQVAISVSRPDVAAAYPHAAGAVISGFRARASLPSTTTTTNSVELSVQVVLEDQTRVPIGLIRTQVGAPAPASYADGPLVSIVMIFLNAARFMEEAIDSVFAQSYDRWELLLVDDGSSDGSTGIARRYAEQHPERVRYLEHEGHQNRGMSASRNLGISQSRGEYIGFLDADDVFLPHKLARQVVVLSSHPEVGMVMGVTELWSSWDGSGDPTSGDDIPVPPTAAIETTIEPPTLLGPFLQGQIIVQVASVLLPRQSVTRVGGFNDAFRGPYEDQVFVAKVFLNERVYVVADCVCRYRQHPDSASATWWRTGVTQYDRPTSAEKQFLRWLEQYLTGNELAGDAVRETLRGRLWPYRHPVRHRLEWASHRLKHRLEALLEIVQGRFDYFKRRLLGRSTGRLWAVPSPVPIVSGWYGLTGVTELRWTSRGTSEVEVHIGGPEGRVFSRSGPCGSARTGKWALDGMVFYLQDTSKGRLRSPADNLATLKIRTRARMDHHRTWQRWWHW